MHRGQPFTCVVMGEETLLIQCAETLLQRGHRLAAVVAANPIIRRWADEHDLPALEPTAALAEQLADRSFDYFFSITNLSIISPAVLQQARRAAINFHDGPLPRYAGLYATSWALLHREHEYGITWHLMGEQVDTGDILKQETFPIDEELTALALNSRCYEVAARSFAELVDELAEDRLQPRRQSMDQYEYFGRSQRPAAASALFWSRPAEELNALVRAHDFGAYANPLGRPKLLDTSGIYLVSELHCEPTHSTAAPGTLLAITDDHLQIATSSLVVTISGLLTVDGQPVDLTARAAAGWQPGYRFVEPSPAVVEQLSALNKRYCRHEDHWRQRLTDLSPLELPYGERGSERASAPRVAVATWPTPPALTAAVTGWPGQPAAAELLLAGWALFLARLGAADRFDLAWRAPTLAGALEAEALFAEWLPLRVSLSTAASVEAGLQAVLAELEHAHRAGRYSRDLVTRYPELKVLAAQGGRLNLPVAVAVGELSSTPSLAPGSELTLIIAPDGSVSHWLYDATIYSPAIIEQLQSQFGLFIGPALAEPSQPLAGISLLSAAEHEQVVVAWNATARDYPRAALVHQLIADQARRTPAAVAVAFGHDQLTYGELERRAERLAAYLQARGVGPGQLVGLFVERSLEMVIGLLGVLKAGAAYVPLDPLFPRERLAFMVEDAQLALLLSQERLLERLPAADVPVLCLDHDWPATAGTTMVSDGVTAEQLAYVIYTSGSTGRPKGVMVTHRNVVNFFAGMDERLEYRGEPGVWLAVTSISFDISVLELLWTLARGFKVVVQADEDRAAVLAPGGPATVDRPIDFSLFYFASAAGGQIQDKYRLLLEGARFADQHGFTAVWTPERHFHEFGGLYPNPAVISAALAPITERIQLRAGSVVLPLQNTLRVAEEWSVVDNLSHGRVGVSFTNGWIADDFVLAPDNFIDRKTIMHEQITAVQSLWRGEAVPFRNGVGQSIPVQIYPRPIQPTLPMWITASGAPATFEAAGALGANLLTHLLGQEVERLADNIRLYRQARQAHGHDPAAGVVTVMLHAFVGDDLETVRETVRRPLIDYLKSSSGLVRTLARSLGHQFDEGDLSEADMEAFLTARFDRYFETSGLMGTVESCLATLERLKAIDVDEVACLVDFGVAAETVLAGLPRLAELHRRANRPAAPVEQDFSLPAQLQRHGVTHFQCTPSMAAMLAATPASLTALQPLHKLLVGGEALPPALATTLVAAVSGQVLNMYGPTETTVWSTTQVVSGDGRAVPIGRPIANTTIYLLDAQRQPVPIGVAGELYIGGDGVTAGYLNRPELTAERFQPGPFSAADQRLYRTGDLARYRADGTLEFLGRIDHQVKVRGYRIELGEIEALLVQHPAVREAVVMARQDVANDTRLVAYVVPAAGQRPATAELRAALKRQLPDYMLPSATVLLERWPLTPNGKIDRRALPAPALARAVATSYSPPSNAVEAGLAQIWSELLRLDQVGLHDNFFDLGAHSLLMLQVSSLVKEQLGQTITLIDIFKYPTVKSLAAFLSQPAQPTRVAAASVNRGQLRRDTVALRQQYRQVSRSPRGSD